MVGPFIGLAVGVGAVIVRLLTKDGKAKGKPLAEQQKSQQSAEQQKPQQPAEQQQKPQQPTEKPGRGESYYQYRYIGSLFETSFEIAPIVVL